MNLNPFTAWRTYKLLELWKEIINHLSTSLRVVSYLDPPVLTPISSWVVNDENEFTCSLSCSPVYIKAVRGNENIQIKIGIGNANQDIQLAVRKILNEVILKKAALQEDGNVYIVRIENVATVSHLDITRLCADIIQKTVRLEALLRETNEERNQITAEFTKIEETSLRLFSETLLSE